MQILPDKNKFQTGDILLFHWDPACDNSYDCCLTFYGCLIQCFTKSKYTHSAMIIRDPPWRPDLKGLYILESSMETFKDAEDHEKKFGVQLVEFDEMIDSFHGSVYWRSLDCIRDGNFRSNLIKAHSIVHNRPYDIIPLDYVKAGLKLYGGNSRRTKTFFCSSLVIFILVQLGLTGRDVPWSVLSPAVLGTEKYTKKLTLYNCRLHPEVKIK